MNDKIPFVESVKCGGCGKVYESCSKDYFAIHGNITKGLDGGIIGNNFGKDYRLERVSIFCQTCLKQSLFPPDNK